MNLLSTADTARRLGLTTRTIARLVASGRISAAVRAPGVRGAYLFDPDEVERFAASRRGVSA